MAGTPTESVPIDEIIRRYDGDRGMLIPMMQDVQAACGYLPQEKLKELSRSLGVPLAQIYSVATFYASFRLMPKGEHTIQLCMGTVCFLKGAGAISQAIQEEFQLVPGATSPDGKFTFAPVNCVGACALAPVMVVDGEYHGNLTVESAVDLLQRIAGGEKPEARSAPPPVAAEVPAPPTAQTAAAGQTPAVDQAAIQPAAEPAGKAKPSTGKKAARGDAASESKQPAPSPKQKPPRGGKQK